MGTWATDEGWPYPDPLGDFPDPAGDSDDDLLTVRADVHLFDHLSPLERRVVDASFGLHGQPERTMHQLQVEMGVPWSDLESALGTGLEKLRMQLSS